MAAEVAHLNSWLSEFLLRLHQAELAATGPQRREAFRQSREAIGAARALGVRGPELAKCLGVTAGSIRGRAAVLFGATISAAELQRLTSATSEMTDVRIPKPLTEVPDQPGSHYRIDDVVQALLSLPD